MNKYRRFFIKTFSSSILISGMFFSLISLQNQKFFKKIKKSKFKNYVWYLDKNDQ